MNISLSHFLPKKTTLAGIIVACSFLFLLASPARAASSPVAQMELIQQLMEMIVALKAQLETLQAQSTEDSYGSTVPHTCVELSQSLWFGTSDATTNGQVGKLQKFLTNTGDFTYGEITGLYGPATVSAVQKWQKRNGIISYGTPDTTGYGTVGEATIKAMRKGCEYEETSPTPVLVAITDITDSENPTITGTATGVDFVGFAISDGDKVYGSGNIPVIKGVWSHKVSTDLMEGREYEVIVYVDNIEYTRESFTIGQNLDVEVIETEATTKEDGSGVFMIEFEVTATDDEKILIPMDNYGSFTNSKGETASAAYTPSFTLVSTADKDGKFYFIDEGDTETFKLMGYLKPSYPGNYKMHMNSLTYYIEDYSENSQQRALSFGGSEFKTASIFLSGFLTSSTNQIVVTAPNGGEKWEIGQLNTITWKPYGYNPDVNPANDVVVYLEDLKGNKVGKIMDTGKASLHTYFNIGNYDTFPKAGQYYVRVKNKVTGASDRSDAPFTLLPRGVDIKVNGSDGPLTLTDNQPVTITTTLGTTFTYCTLNGVRKSVNGATGIELEDKSEINGYAYAPNSNSSTAIYMTCTKADGTTRSDSVGVDMAGPGQAASVEIISPNGGEVIDPNEALAITSSMEGLSSYSLALYKNDQWKAWLVKDEQISSTMTTLRSWTLADRVPSDYLQGLGEGDNAGAVFKLYITGIKADGSGYVDDKSDAPFSFSKSVTTSSCKIIDIYANQVPGYVYYELFVVTNNGLAGKIEDSTVLGITGADSWDSLKFTTHAIPGLSGNFKSTQTLNGTGVNYVLSRKNNISLLDPSGNVICSAIGTVSKVKQVSPLASGLQTTNTQCTDLSRDMHRGAESSAVLSLQKFLVSKGLLHEEPTAFYGDLTVGAVKAYQKSVGLPETGMVYEFTRNAIQKETCTP